MCISCARKKKREGFLSCLQTFQQLRVSFKDQEIVETPGDIEKRHRKKNTTGVFSDQRFHCLPPLPQKQALAHNSKRRAKHNVC
uniref:Uncharacterized protein n=1 Tax=Hyaloperonospora arabidopsidis (strain Emoy2) TaxID=559515 RepID=M4C170_HYAAE